MDEDDGLEVSDGETESFCADELDGRRDERLGGNKVDSLFCRCEVVGKDENGPFWEAGSAGFVAVEGIMVST